MRGKVGQPPNVPFVCSECSIPTALCVGNLSLGTSTGFRSLRASALHCKFAVDFQRKSRREFRSHNSPDAHLFLFPYVHFDFSRHFVENDNDNGCRLAVTVEAVTVHLHKSVYRETTVRVLGPEHRGKKSQLNKLKELRKTAFALEHLFLQKKVAINKNANSR